MTRSSRQLQFIWRARRLSRLLKVNFRTSSSQLVTGALRSVSRFRWKWRSCAVMNLPSPMERGWLSTMDDR